MKIFVKNQQSKHLKKNEFGSTTLVHWGSYVVPVPFEDRFLLGTESVSIEQYLHKKFIDGNFFEAHL
jgi:hypothetical protein